MNSTSTLFCPFPDRFVRTVPTGGGPEERRRGPAVVAPQHLIGRSRTATTQSPGTFALCECDGLRPVDGGAAAGNRQPAGLPPSAAAMVAVPTRRLAEAGTRELSSEEAQEAFE